jgi:hypothetical protein
VDIFSEQGGKGMIDLDQDIRSLKELNMQIDQGSLDNDEIDLIIGIKNHIVKIVTNVLKIHTLNSQINNGKVRELFGSQLKELSGSMLSEKELKKLKNQLEEFQTELELIKLKLGIFDNEGEDDLGKTVTEIFDADK